jgi:hypothetical protein
MVPPQGMLSRANSQALRKLPRLKLKLTPRWRMPKLSWRLRKPRCKGVGLSVFERMFCKDILAQLMHRTFHEMELVFLWISFGILMFVSLHLFTWIIWFSSNAEARWPVAGEIVPISTEAPPPGRVPLSMRIQGSGASQKTSARQGPCLASVRGRG